MNEMITGWQERWGGYSGYSRGFLLSIGLLALNVSIIVVTAIVLSLIPWDTWMEMRESDWYAVPVLVVFFFMLAEVVAVLMVSRPRSLSEGASQFFVVLGLLPFSWFIPFTVTFFLFTGSST